MQGTGKNVATALACGDVDEAGFDAPALALLRFAKKLTLTPAAMDPGDIEPLRENGWSDSGIAEAVYVIGMFAFFNRVAEAFGLENPSYDGEQDSDAVHIHPATSFEPKTP